MGVAEVNWLTQCKYEILRNLRNRRFAFFSVLLPVGFYFLFVNLDGPNMRINGTNWASYYMISMATFSVVGGGLNGMASKIAFERTQGWLRLVQTTPLRPFNYVTTKIVASLLMNLIQVFILFALASIFEPVHLTVGIWIISALFIAVGGLVFIVLGMLIGQLIGMDAANIVASAVYFALSIFGGLWFPVTILPAFLKHVAEGIPTYHLAHLAWQLAGSHLPTVGDVAILVGYFALFSLLAIWVTGTRTESRAV
jgi:ABC-2 type transport system permease protein